MTTTGNAVRSNTGGGERSHHDLPPERLFSILSNRRRRSVLRYLLSQPRADITTLSRHVAAEENDCSPGDVSDKQEKRAYSALHQTHIPRLRETGIVAYDADDRTVELRANRRQLRRHLAADDERDRQPDERFSIPWSRYFLAAALLGSLSLASHWFATLPSIPLATEQVHGLLNVAFMTLAIAFAMDVEAERTAPAAQKQS